MRCLLLAFSLGVVMLQQQPGLPSPWLVVTVLLPILVATACALYAKRAVGARRRIASAATFLIAALSVSMAGFFYAAWRADARLADALPPAWEGQDIALVGVIDDLPQPADRGTRFAFAVERILTPDAVVPSRLSLAWYNGWPLAGARAGAKAGATDAIPEIHAGERWVLTVRLKRPHGTVNPHGFDVEAWLLQNEFRATGYVRADDDNHRVDAFAARVTDYVARARESIRTRILRSLEGRRYAGVIAALAIGDERAIPNEQWQLFNRTGIGHLISISGLHITFFAALIGGLAYWLWKRSHALTTRLPARKAAAVAGVTAAFIYVLLAGFEIPAQRTLYMLTIAAIGLWLGRPGSASVVWLWALAVVLAWDPWATLTPGFWLSFGAVGLLLYIGVGRIGGASKWREALRAQAAITLGLIPLMLVLFQQISIVSPLANAVAIPVVTFIVVPLTLASIVVPWDVLLIIAHQAFAWVALMLEWLSAMPAAVWQQHAPGIFAAVAGILGVLWLLAPRGVPGRALGLIWLAPLFVIVPLLPAMGTFTVTVLDVGQGLAVLVQTHAHSLLYDTGPRFSETADAGNRIVAPMLRANGIARLDGLIVSHQDSDHSGGALSLLQTVPVQWVSSSLKTDHPIVRARAERGEAAWRCLSGQTWTWDGVEFEILHPVDASYVNPKLRPNDLSCVLRVSNAAGSALLTGDIEARTESDLIRREPARLRSDLLVVPHHGSRTSSTPAFIASVRPEVAAFTPGYRNRFNHPRPEIVERYVAAGVRNYRTDYDGALTFTFAEGSSRVPRRERAHDARYWRDAPVEGELAPLD
ncbi:MAG TPA: DNA internalization-related competence protein ComEC/Rec2 [Casimicrobiaceae bacterium]|nr:DNA internalization-related competence protein ComEC/Rec2 [Casimicrobiaceae bacterium]